MKQVFVGTWQQLMPRFGLGQPLAQSASDEHITEQTSPLPLELLDELDEVVVVVGLPPLPPLPLLPSSPPSPPSPGLLPKGVLSPSAQAAKLSPQSPIARRSMLACFTGLCFEVTRMPGCTQLPTLQFDDD